jgi:hypothetical protein
MFEGLATGAQKTRRIKTHRKRNYRSNQTSLGVKYYYEDDSYHVDYYAAWHWIGQGAEARTSRPRIGKQNDNLVVPRSFASLFRSLADIASCLCCLSLLNCLARLLVSHSASHTSLDWPVSTSTVLVALNLRPTPVRHRPRCPGRRIADICAAIETRHR